MELRTALPDDAAAIARVHRLAFGRGDEAALVAAIQPERTRPEWSVVAVAPGEGAGHATGEVAGHVALSHADLVQAAGGVRPVALLAPIGVVPARQGRGIGGALVGEAIGRALAAGEPVLIVQGDSAYYRRFGFEPAAALGIAPPSEAIPGDAFMARRLGEVATDLRGRVIYPPPFAGPDDVAAQLVVRRRELAAELDRLVEPPPPGSTVGFGKRIGDGTTEAVERISTTAVARSIASSLADVDRALAKVVAGTYGRCDGCGEPIPPARLTAKPAAATCVGCAA